LTIYSAALQNQSSKRGHRSDGLEDAIIESIVTQIQVFQVLEIKEACHNQLDKKLY
jgi:hypothetical protein